MIARRLHLPVQLPHVTWTQVQYGALVALCVGGYVIALALGLHTL